MADLDRRQGTRNSVTDLVRMVTQRVEFLHSVREMGNAGNLVAAAHFIELARQDLPLAAGGMADAATMLAESLADCGPQAAPEWSDTDSEELRHFATLFDWVAEAMLKIDGALQECQSPQATTTTIADLGEVITHQMAFLHSVRETGQAGNPVAAAHFVELARKYLPLAARDMADAITTLAESLARYGPQGTHEWSGSEYQELRHFTTLIGWVAEGTRNIDDVLRECRSQIA